MSHSLLTGVKILLPRWTVETSEELEIIDSTYTSSCSPRLTGYDGGKINMYVP